MTHEEAKDLVLELVIAAQEFDRRRDKYYSLQFEEVRDRVVAALAANKVRQPAAVAQS